ncbi:MAG: tetratricopeptide repeat protein [Candidatus Omnitrophota bacterium]
MIKKLILLLILYLWFSLPIFADTIILKSGKKVEGRIIEETDEHIKIDFSGVLLTYYTKDIENIDRATLKKEIEGIRLSQASAVNLSSGGIDVGRIRRLLQELGYPERAWPDMERELTLFLTDIGFFDLKSKAKQAKSPIQLKEFISKLGVLIRQKGYLNPQSPQPLIKLLVTSLADEDIFRVIETSTIGLEEKKELRRTLVSCSATAQLASIILSLLDIKVKAAVSPNHDFNCVPLDERQFLFVDFINQIFEIVDIERYYNIEGKYLILKEGHPLSPEEVSKVEEQWIKIPPKSLREILSVEYYNIYITDDFLVTPSMYYNFSHVYFKKRDYDQAILNCNRALRLNPNLAEAYGERGSANTNKGNDEQAVSDFNKAIEINPNDAEFYESRAIAYFNTNNYDKSWDDVCKAELLGHKVDKNFINALRKYSGRVK